MNLHKNARLTPRGREWIVSQVASGQTPKAVGEAVGVCPRTVRKWVGRYGAEGGDGLNDRSSRPHRLYRPTEQAVVERIEALQKEYPKSPQNDLYLYGLVLAHARKNNIAVANRFLSDLKAKFPGSTYIDTARQTIADVNGGR